MVQQGALGKAGRAGCVLDLHRVCRVRVAQLAFMLPGEQGVMVGQEDAVADGRDFAADRVGDLLHRVAAEIPDIIDRLGAGLFEHEFELALLVGRVHGDEGDTCQATGEFQQHPFRHIVGVDRDAGAFGMAARKGPGKALGVVQQVRIGPCPQHRAVIAEFLQGRAAGRRGGRGAQHAADGDGGRFRPALCRKIGVLEFDPVHVFLPHPAFRVSGRTLGSRTGYSQMPRLSGSFRPSPRFRRSIPAATRRRNGRPRGSSP